MGFSLKCRSRKCRKDVNRNVMSVMRMDNWKTNNISDPCNRKYSCFNFDSVFSGGFLDVIEEKHFPIPSIINLSSFLICCWAAKYWINIYQRMMPIPNPNYLRKMSTFLPNLCIYYIFLLSSVYLIYPNFYVFTQYILLLAFPISILTVLFS